ncbi:TIGR03862 family flavoprotein [Aerophototrophica crusticola]|uniref:TIGR03862 family flavoprotein n=1 Tax=Aerophototrophica crusticola TaxID=1709002 RepID=A0A858R817_9PROT|nr:TIGR03862 family flavoprotein [Rhodospirillaceae bacterium B3]
MDDKRKNVAVIGGGPAGLMAAEVMAAAGLAVDVYDSMPSVGRKFLMAGRGGLNITHSEPLDRFLSRYGEARPLFERLLRRFTPADLRAWCEGLGVPTFVGSSGRVFPKTFKASVLLRAWLNRLAGQGVRFHLRHRWLGFGPDGTLRLESPEGPKEIRPAATVLALGGASWPRLGSDGSWAPLLARSGVGIAPFRPSNSGFDLAWSPGFLEKAEGEPLKRITLTFAGRTVPGELVVTRAGLEGGPLYALSAPIRDAIEREGQAVVSLDLKPDLTLAQVQNKLARSSPSDSLANRLRKGLSLAPPAGPLLREFADGQDLSRPATVAALVKALPIPLTGVRGLDRAISSAGGIRLGELDEGLMLTKLPGVFACGEMLDWEAPTGGYLLQGCMASGVTAGEGVRKYVDSSMTVL